MSLLEIVIWMCRKMIEDEILQQYVWEGVLMTNTITESFAARCFFFFLSIMLSKRIPLLSYGLSRDA